MSQPPTLERTFRRIFIFVGLFMMLVGLVILTNRLIEQFLLSVLSSWKGQPPDPHWAGRLEALALVTLICGFGLLILGWLVIPRRDALLSLASREKYALSAALILLVLWLPFLIIGHSAIIAGQRYWWLSDDAMISMRYARNLAEGLGLVWNPGEKVEGYTNFLWTIYMALIHLFPIPAAKTSLVILLTNLGLAIACLPVIVRIIHWLGGGRLAVISALAGYVLNRNLMAWTTAGFETTLLTFLFLLSLYRVLQESELGQPRRLTYLLIGLMSLIRADTLVISALLYALAWVLTAEKKTVLAYAAFSLLLPVAHELFRIYYYGDFLPNTAYLKTSNWSGRYRAGFGYVLEFARNYGFLIALAVFGALRPLRAAQRYLLGIFLLYAAYLAYVGGDVFPNFRFFVPVIPLLFILAFTGLQASHFPYYLKLAGILLCLGTMPLFILHYTQDLAPQQDDVGNLQIGLLLKQNTPPGSKVADYWAGSVFYFSEQTVGIDFLGKSDRFIARLPVTHGGTKPGHNKFDFDYSLGVLKPDIVAAAFELPVDEAYMRQSSTGDWASVGQLYLNPVFQEHCLPYPVQVNTWRTLFVCDWSPLLEARAEWGKLK